MDSKTNYKVKSECLSLFNELIYQIDDSFNLLALSKKITTFILEKFNLELCELKLAKKEEDRIFILNSALRIKDVIINDSIETEKIFGVRKTKYEHSRIGYLIDNDSNEIWTATHNENFERYIEKLFTQKRIDRESAINYLKKIPSKGINNFLIITNSSPKSKSTSAHYSFCIHIFNALNGSKDKNKIMKFAECLIELLSLIFPYVYKSLYFKKTTEEYEINEFVKKIMDQSTNFELVLDEVANHFSEKLKSAMHTIWFYNNDIDNELLGLHSIMFNHNYCGNKDLTEDAFFSIIKDTSVIPHILKKDNSVMGQLINDIESPGIKILDINDNRLTMGRYQWHKINEALDIKHFVAIPIRDGNKIIAIIGLHPSLSDQEFESESLSYYKNFCNQISPYIKYLMEYNFSKNLEILEKKMQKIIKKRSELFYKEIVFTINSIIRSEACSLFEARFNENEKEGKGVYLLATTDKSQESQVQINQKKYNFNNESITGFVALSLKPINIYDVEKVKQYYPKIRKRGTSFIEQVESIYHNTLIAVPTMDDHIDDEPFYIIRCINKKSHTEKKSTYKEISDLFCEQDKNLLKNVGIILEGYRNVHEVLKERNDLIEVILHENENPITSLRNKVDYINNRVHLFSGSEVEKAKLRIKLKDINLMVALLKNNLKLTEILSQLLQGKDINAIKSTDIDLNKSIVNVTHWLIPQLKNENLDLSSIIIKEFPFRMHITMDEHHLDQILYNIINNSIKYRKEKSEYKLEISFSKEIDGLKMLFSDSGVGVEESSAAYIFDLGYRSRYAQENVLKGKGFGLFVCKKLLESNGMDIQLINKVNPTQFQIIIPNDYVTYYYKSKY
jgi:hypothetical protein